MFSPQLSNPAKHKQMHDELALHKLTPATDAEQLSLLTPSSHDPRAAAGAKQKRARLSAAIDQITRRYGSDAVTTGIVPGEGSSFTGTKIAFTRVPELEDFDEVLATLRAAPRTHHADRDARQSDP